MEIIGITTEYNPFHNGHLYQINKIKELFPDSIIVLILNGYFLERGEISIESKEEKTRLALKYGVDIVIENPFLFGSQSADTFASSSLELMNALKVKKIVFGSESNNIEELKSCAKAQLTNDFNVKIKEYLNNGDNYPTALNKASGFNISSPNDLLGVSYIKAIIKNNYPIEPVTIQRTNDYHDINDNSNIISASNIREKIKNNINIDKYIPEGNILTINYDLLFNLLKSKIITEHNLSDYLTVDEGIDNRLKSVINNVNSIEELIEAVKTKRYTRNRIMRMFIHILIGLKKEDNKTNNEYIRLLGISNKGQNYINSIKKELALPLVTKMNNIDSVIYSYELKASKIYDILTNSNTLKFELSNRPLKKQEN